MADEFDLNNTDTTSTDGVLFPMSDAQIEEFFPVLFKITDNEYAQFVPILPRMLSEEEKLEKAQREAEERAKQKQLAIEKQKKIDENFTEKEVLEQVEKVKAEVVTKSEDADFFNSLEGSEIKPINME